MLAVHGLLGDSEPLGDFLPRPAELARVIDLEDLQPLGEHSQGGHRAEADVGVGAASALGDVPDGVQDRQLMLTERKTSTYADALSAP